LAEAVGELGDYELQEEVGRGGQGVVFRARQKSLNRTVALKVISLGQWASKAHLKRFRREAEAAASLDHPGIVPIHEVSERDGSCYFSMQFIEGGQLDEVVRGAPMSIRHAVELIAKVARTVHYAHEHGILHRDIKPGNILLDKKGEPHLTDFGLARLLDTQSSVTRTIDVLGTPSYMAPEQAAGETRKLSKATDVYGLGAVFYQLLTGQPPFAGGTTYETIRLLRDTEPRPPRLLNPKVDRDLSTICLKCLEKDPQRRYSSALALAEDLERWRNHEPILAKPSGFFTHGRKWVRRNPSTAVLVTLLIVVLAGLGVTVWNHKPAHVIPKSVAVLPFENLSDDPNNAYFADGIQEEILTRLAAIVDLKVISRSSTQRYHSKPGNLAEIAKQLGVANIVEGSVQKTADQVRVNVQLINAQTDSHLWADTYDRDLTDIFQVESDIAKGIAAALQAKLTGREGQLSAVKPTNNPEAYDAYLRGLAFHARSFYSEDALRKAVGFFEQAVELDPDFALAWARLSRAQAWKYYHNDPVAFRRDVAKNALDNAQKLAPNSAETLLALAYYQRHLLGDLEAAKTTFKRVSEILPGTSEVTMALGRIARDEGHWDESNSYLDRALSLDPRNVDLLSLAALNYTMLRQFPAALRFYDRALDIVPKDSDLIAAKAGIYQAQGNLKEAAMLLSELNAQSSSWMSFQAKLIQLRLERNYDEAIHSLQTRLAQYQFLSMVEKGDDQSMLAVFQRLADDSTGASLTAKQARDVLKEACESQPTLSGSLWDNLSVVNAVIGEKDSALKAAERAIMLSPSTKDPVNGPNREEHLALVQAIVGDNSSAISTLARLLRTPYYPSEFYLSPVTPALLTLDPLWDPLRADPAFQKLCEEKIDKSIAVLPFENLSGDPNNAYFAEGIQDEILTRLAKVADLKVISRTSTQRYKSKPQDLGEIAKQLGVANVLEGSVQKAGDQVRVNVQLINAQTDSHLWADTYDRKLIDILAVESEIAKGIAESLQAKLTSREKQALAVKPTNNAEAYDAYLRGLAYTLRPGATTANTLGAQKYLREAVRLDPKFALSWALLSYVSATGYVLQRTVALCEESGQAAETALTLQPNLGEALLAQGQYHYACLQDYETAVRYFEWARQFMPNSSRVPESLASVTRRRGQWDRSEAYFNEAERLDPRNVHLLSQHAISYMALRRFPEALRKFDQVLNITPDDIDTLAAKAEIVQAEGDLPRASALLAPLHVQADNALDTQVYQAILERRPAHIIPQLKEVLAKPDPALADLESRLRFYLGWAQEVAGDYAGAQESWRQQRIELESLLEERPEDFLLIDGLALTNMGLGDKAAALTLAERAMAVIPMEKDAIVGLGPIEVLARVAARVGEPDRSIAALQKVLSTPYVGYFGPPLTPALLRLDPMFDSLRGDPRFQKLCEEKQP
jgi:TolB-like protein/Tfp pilus assembly protein PilF/tRNA A-37 threonylcarbamoyl transferase component Bud32